MEFKSFQQQISNDVLFIKHRKLFYVLLSSSDVIKHSVKDVLTFKQTHSFKNTTKIFDDTIDFELLQCSLNNTESRDFIEPFFQITGDENGNLNQIDNEQRVYHGEKPLDVIQQIAVQKLVINDIANIIRENQINSIQVSQLFSLYDNYIEKGQQSINKPFSLTFNQSYNKTIYQVGNYNSIDIYLDDNSSLYVLNHNYIFKLYLDKTFLTDISEYIYNGVFSKDLFFSYVQLGNIYIKIYTSDGKFVKKVLLKKPTNSVVQFKDVSFNEETMFFKSNKQHLIGYNIYHGNSICEIYSCFFGDNYNILYHKPQYNVLSIDNAEYDKFGLIFKGNGSIMLRVNFPFLVYIKSIIPNFSIQNIDYNIQIRYGLNNYINNITFRQYENKDNTEVKYDNSLDVYDIQGNKIQLYDENHKPINAYPYVDYFPNNELSNIYDIDGNSIDIYDKNGKKITNVYDDENSIPLWNFSTLTQYKGFYCKTIDIIFNCKSSHYSRLYSIDFQLYNMQKQDIITTPNIIFNEGNTIFLNKDNIISDQDINIHEYNIQQNGLNIAKYKTGYGNKAINQYILNNNYFLSGYNNLSTFALSNIVTDKVNNYIESDDREKKSYIWFSLTREAVAEKNYQYYAIEYDVIPKKVGSQYIDFKYFSLRNIKSNYPRYIVYDYNGTTLQFHYQGSTKNFDENNNIIGYYETWRYNNQEDMNHDYSDSYFMFSYQKTNNVWKRYFSFLIRIDGDNTDINFIGVNKIQLQSVLQSGMSTTIDNYQFIDDDNSIGFKIVSNIEYVFNKKPFKPFKINLYTSNEGDNPINPHVNTGSMEVVSGNNFNTPSGEKRNFKLVFQDGDNWHIRIYNIVFQNFNFKISSNEFNRIQIDNWDVAGNNISDTSNFSDMSIINNNFYNIMYCVNSYYSSPYTGKIFQSNNLYFDKSKYALYNRSNIHIEWQKHDGLQYLILFDKFDTASNEDLQKYSDYFLPFHEYRLNKKCDLQYDQTLTQNDKHQHIRVFEYVFDKPQIVLSMNIKFKTVKGQYKVDYFYSYTENDYQWSDWIYYYPFKAIYVKHLKIKCIIKTNNNVYYDLIPSPILLYVDSNIYHLTSENSFESAYITNFIQNTKYMLFLRKIYNDSIFDTTLKLFQIGNFTLLPKIQDLYVDQKKCENELLIVSGYDNICQINFNFPNGISYNNLYQINIKFFLIKNNEYILIDDIYNTVSNNDSSDYSQNGFDYVYDYQLPLNNDKSTQIYAYKVRYFDRNYQVSNYSDTVIFKFNNIPSTPYKLQVAKK